MALGWGRLGVRHEDKIFTGILLVKQWPETVIQPAVALTYYWLPYWLRHLIDGLRMQSNEIEIGLIDNRKTGPAAKTLVIPVHLKGMEVPVQPETP